MAAMLGNATRRNRQGGWWWYCCQGHDGLWKHYIKHRKSGQRYRENRQWRREYGV